MFLLLSQHWNLRDTDIGTPLATFAGVIVQTPAGAFLDRFKVGMIVGLGTLMGAGFNMQFEQPCFTARVDF